MLKTNENGNMYEHSLDHALEFFSKAGSIFEGRKAYYNNEESALSLFQKVWIVDKEIAFKLLLWLRDCRGGAGNRSAFRSILKWLAEYDWVWIVKNIEWIPKVGRWDDLRTLFNTPLENLVSNYWADAIRENNVLAAKWADRKDKSIKHALNIKEEGKFRKLLASIRKNHIVEHKMCNENFEEINYETIPSVAMSRYTNAFERNDPDGFLNFKTALDKGEKKVNASVLFPHDCVKTVREGDRLVGDKQFEALPNYLEGTNEKIIVLSDTSGSMSMNSLGNVTACDVSQALALYCSSKIPEDNPFHKKFIGFCSEANFKDWNGMSFSEAVNDRRIFDGAVGSTRIDKALLSILKQAKYWNLTNEQMPSLLLIVSDMQFHEGVIGRGTEVKKCMNLWKEEGYNIPKIVYWNLTGYVGSPEVENSHNTGLVSGFSPSILKAVLTGEDFSPIGIMKRALEKYEIVIP